MNLISVLIDEFDNSISLEAIKTLFSKYDRWFYIIIFLKTQDFLRWRLLWEKIYLYSKYTNFLNISFCYDKFLNYIENIYYDIINGKNLNYQEDNDLTLFFSGKSIDDIKKVCNKIDIHSSFGEERLTFETCHDLIYFLIGGKFCYKIKYNDLMKKICIDLEKYLYSHFYTLSNFVNKAYLEKDFLYNYHRSLKQGGDYIVLDNFINDSKTLEFNEYKKFIVIEKRSTPIMRNKTVFVPGIKAYNLFKFYNSPLFLRYIKLFFGEKVKYGNLIDIDLVLRSRGFPFGGIFQVYEYNDYLDWHTDTYVDMYPYDNRKYAELGSLIYYIGTSEKNNWIEKNGGVFYLGTKNNLNKISINKIEIPVGNKLILLKTSTNSYHKVSKVLKKGGWRLSYQNLLIKYNSYINDTGYIYNKKL